MDNKLVRYIKNYKIISGQSDLFKRSHVYIEMKVIQVEMSKLEFQNMNVALLNIKTIQTIETSRNEIIRVI